MSANTELFVQVLAQIEKHPETWDQRNWVNDCGTAFCFAGWAVKLCGHDIVKPCPCHAHVPTLADRPSVGIAAATMLGLDLAGDIEFDLFTHDNTLDDLYRISADICGLDVQVLREKVAAVVADGQVQQP